MYGCESWTIKKAEHRRIDNFELWYWKKLFESPLDHKEIQPVHPKLNQSLIFIGRTDAETPVLWPPDAKNWLIWKDPDAGKDWRQKKGTTEDEIVWWHQQLDGREFEQALGVGDGPRSLACCSHGAAESDTTERLNHGFIVFCHWNQAGNHHDWLYTVCHMELKVPALTWTI